MSTRRERAKEPTKQLNRQLLLANETAQKEALRNERRKKVNDWAGELFTDMAKLVFAGVILGGVFEKVENPILLYGAGFTFLAVFLVIGYVFINKN
jgi:hypothetical protein